MSWVWYACDEIELSLTTTNTHHPTLSPTITHYHQPSPTLSSHFILVPFPFYLSHIFRHVLHLLTGIAKEKKSFLFSLSLFLAFPYFPFFFPGLWTSSKKRCNGCRMFFAVVLMTKANLLSNLCLSLSCSHGQLPNALLTPHTYLLVRFSKSVPVSKQINDWTDRPKDGRTHRQTEISKKE